MASHAAASAVTRTGVGGANQGNMGFVPEIWSGRTMKALDDSSYFLQLVNRDYEGDIKAKGDTVRIHHVGNIVAKPYVIGARDTTNALRNESVVYQTATGASMLFSIDAADYFAFEVEDIEQTQADPKYVSNLTARAGVALAQSTDRYIFDKMLDASAAGADEFDQAGSGSTSVDVATAGGLYDALVDIGVKLDDNLCPEDGRYIVLPSFLYANMLKDTRFVGAGASTASSILEKGKRGLAGSLAGFKIYTMARKTFKGYLTGKQSTQVLADTTTTLNPVHDSWTNSTTTSDDIYWGVAGVKDAFTFADQITKTENIRLSGAFADGVRGMHVYGGKAVRPQWIHKVIVTDDQYTAD